MFFKRSIIYDSLSLYDKLSTNINYDIVYDDLLCRVININ